MIRFERRDVWVSYQWVDGRGYLYCHDCTPPEQRAELEFAAPPHSEEECSLCGRIVNTVVVRTKANVEIEYVSCRIF